MKKLLMIVSLALMMVPALAQNHTDYTLPEMPKRAKYIDYSDQEHGFWFAVETTPAMGFSKTGSSFCINGDIILGYRVGEFFRLGAGVSPRYAAIGRKNFGLPVFLDLRGNIISQESRMVVPYWSLDGGYSFIQKGIYASPTIGIRAGMPRHDFIAGLTYIFQQDAINNAIFHAVGLKIGYEF